MVYCLPGGLYSPLLPWIDPYYYELTCDKARHESQGNQVVGNAGALSSLIGWFYLPLRSIRTPP